MTYITPAHVSELEVAHTTDGHPDDAYPEDCVWCSGLMLHLAAHPEYGTPASHTEAERLRLDAGKPLTERGSTLAELVKGYTIRYRYTPTVISGFTAAWKALTTGKGAVVTGLMGNLPAGHRLRRFSPNYTGGHAVYVARMDDQMRVWWMDPLAPQGTYGGEWASSSELASFMASNATAVVQPLAEKEVEVPIVTAIKGEDWTPTVTNGVSNGVLRATPDRAAAIVARVPAGQALRTIAECKATAAEPTALWRLTEWAGAPAYALRSDWTPLVQGGDPATDQRLTDYIARKDPPAPTPLPAGVYKVGA